MMLRRVLVVDDEHQIADLVSHALRTHGYDVEVAATCREAIARFRDRPPDAAVIDHSLPDGTGLELLARMKEIAVTVPVLMMTGHASIDLAVSAVKAGAEQFLTKPIMLSSMLVMVQRAIENSRNRRRQVAISARESRDERDPFAGVSSAIGKLAEQANMVLRSDRPVLIQGETGTGKGVLATWLCQHGPRADEAFVDINCASLSPDLLESELFGHERGAFTGAATSKLGLLEVADRGTVFLDEIGEIGVAMQPRLLKVLEEKRFRRVGDVRDRTVDVRLITATNRDLAQLVQRGAFRSDLYYRINTLRLAIPPLRQRPEDIPILARAVLADIGVTTTVELTPAATRAMQGYGWPGNVRELRNVVERAVLLLDGASRLDVHHLIFDSRMPEGSGLVELTPDHTLTLEQMERRHVERVVRLEQGSVDRAAIRLGVSRSTLYQKLKRYRDQDGRNEEPS